MNEKELNSLNFEELKLLASAYVDKDILDRLLRVQAEKYRKEKEEIFKEFRRVASENYSKDDGLVCDVYDLIDEVEKFLEGGD